MSGDGLANEGKDLKHGRHSNVENVMLSHQSVQMSLSRENITFIKIPL